MKTTKMKFTEDKFVNGECVYQHGKTYDIPIVSVERWLKRGGTIVGDKEQLVETEVKKVEVLESTIVGKEEVETPAKPEVKEKKTTKK